MDYLDRRIRGVAFWAAVGAVGFVVAAIVGCGSGVGTNLAGTISLADARKTCLDWDSTPGASDAFDTLVLVAEAQRDDGLSEANLLVALAPLCEDEETNGGDFLGCLSCFTQIAAAVWN